MHTVRSLRPELNPGPQAHQSAVLATRPPGGSLENFYFIINLGPQQVLATLTWLKLPSGVSCLCVYYYHYIYVYYYYLIITVEWEKVWGGWFLYLTQLLSGHGYF